MAERHKSSSEIERQQMANASAVPGMDFKLNPKAGVFRPTNPVYHPVRPVGLFNAR